MGFTLYVIDTETGEYIHYGKELEVKGRGNHIDTVAMLQFFLDKCESHHILEVRRFDLHDSDTPMLKKDVSEEYQQYAKEELLDDLPEFLTQPRQVSRVELSVGGQNSV